MDDAKFVLLNAKVVHVWYLITRFLIKLNQGIFIRIRENSGNFILHSEWEPCNAWYVRIMGQEEDVGSVNSYPWMNTLLSEVRLWSV